MPLTFVTPNLSRHIRFGPRARGRSQLPCPCGTAVLNQSAQHPRSVLDGSRGLAAAARGEIEEAEHNG